jgi:asparagine synthase (glutamine-hydrolysing)
MEDERRFARLAADRAGTPLLELAWGDRCRPIDARILHVPLQPKPILEEAFLTTQTELMNEIACRLKFETVWTGQGGDHLFVAFKSSIGASDYLRLHGFGLRWWGAVKDSARLSKTTKLSVLRTALRTRKPGTLWRNEPLPPNSSFLPSAAITRDLQQYIRHPWTVDVGHLPPGKQLQIQELADLLNRQRPTPGRIYDDEHHPLMSQPLIELSLQIPSFVHLRGGRTRSLARDAFSGCLPQQILSREDKGATTNFTMGLLRRSEKFLHELLLDGELSRRGLIDKSTLELHIKQGKPIRLDQMFGLMGCITAEAWVRNALHSGSQRRSDSSASSERLVHR